MQQVAVGGVDLDTVHAGVDGPARRSAEILDDRGDLLGGQRTRHRQWLLARRGVGGHVGGDGRRCHRLHPADLRVPHPSDVPQLHEHPAALGVHGVGDLGPVPLMPVGVDARGVHVGAVGLRGYGGGLGDDHARRCALCVVGDREVRRRSVGLRPRPRQRRHEHSVCRRRVADPDRLQQCRAVIECERHARSQRHRRAVHSRRSDQDGQRALDAPDEHCRPHGGVPPAAEDQFGCRETDVPQSAHRRRWRDARRAAWPGSAIS